MASKNFNQMTVDELRNLAQKLKETEAELAASKKTLAKVQGGDGEGRSAEVADRIRAVVSKQLAAQMVYQKEWRDQLEKTGREIVAYVHDVNSDAMSALGLDACCGGQRMDAKTRLANSFFGDQLPEKNKIGYKNSETLSLNNNLSVKYIKLSGELKITATYKLKTESKKRKCDARDGGDNDNADDGGVDVQEEAPDQDNTHPEQEDDELGRASDAD